MQTVIGEKLIRQQKPSEKPFEVRDAKLKGFILRVQPSGSMSFICEFGRGKRITLGPTEILTVHQAKSRAKQILADAVKGIDPRAEKRKEKAHTFASFLDEDYGPWLFANLKSKRNASRALTRLKSFSEIENKKLHDISTWLLEKWRFARQKEGTSDSTINRDIAELKSSLSKAVDWDMLESNPLAKFKLAKQDYAPKVRFLDESEEARLRDALKTKTQQLREGRERGNAWRRERGYPELPATPHNHLRPLVLLAMNTGMRRGELFSLQWEDVDLDKALLTVVGSTAKSGKTRHLPLNSEAVAVLAEWKAKVGSHNALIFPGKGGDRLDNINTAWRTLMKKAEITVFRFHDLRHHFASKLVMAGVDLNTVRELLGHGDIKMTLRYAHLAPEHKAAAVEKIVTKE